MANYTVWDTVAILDDMEQMPSLFQEDVQRARTALISAERAERPEQRMWYYRQVVGIMNTLLRLKTIKERFPSNVKRMNRVVAMTRDYMNEEIKDDTDALKHWTPFSHMFEEKKTMKKKPMKAVVVKKRNYGAWGEGILNRGVKSVR